MSKPTDETVLRMSGISKTFPGTRALDAVNLQLKRGEIHALVGNNGSGKSTLIKILAGVQAADPGGTITVGGATYDAAHFSSKDARRAGLHFVHQVPALFPYLTVAENLAIGRGFETGRLGWVHWRRQRARAGRLLERFHIRALPEQPLWTLDPADRTLVAIARALQDQEEQETGVLVLDEPTAALPGSEVQRLLGTLRRYADKGQAILFVSHHLEEVLQISHRVSALRDGRHVGTLQTECIDEKQIISLMLGRALSAQQEQRSTLAEGRASVLEVAHLAGGAVRDANFALHRGEILGLAGIVGSGAADVPALLFAAKPRTGGTLRFEGEVFMPRDPAEAISHGFAFLPADRALEASFAPMSLRANLSAPRVARYFQRLRLRHNLERDDARAAISRFLVRASSEEQPLSTLSGGNQQKVVLARWLHDQPKVLLLNEPTQGVDVHAQQEIHGLLRRAADQGAAILVVSSDFRELAEVCDRVLVMGKGALVAELIGPELDTHRITELSHFAP